MERSALGHMAGVMSITLWPTAHNILHREQGQGRGGRLVCCRVSVFGRVCDLGLKWGIYVPSPRSSAG